MTENQIKNIVDNIHSFVKLPEDLNFGGSFVPSSNNYFYTIANSKKTPFTKYLNIPLEEKEDIGKILIALGLDDIDERVEYILKNAEADFDIERPLYFIIINSYL